MTPCHSGFSHPTRMESAERITAAWAGVDPPDEALITNHRCDECDEITAYFAGKRWQDVTNLTEIGHHADALFLFSNAAFHYYLPAFMLAVLNDPGAIGIVPDNIAANFRNELGCAARDRLAAFDPMQRVVVGEFLEMLLPELCATDQDDIRVISALLRGD
jgi:hypothetical protein